MIKIVREPLEIHDPMFSEWPTPFTPNLPRGSKPSTPSSPSDTDGPEGSAKVVRPDQRPDLAGEPAQASLMLDQLHHRLICDYNPDDSRLPKRLRSSISRRAAAMSLMMASED